MKISSIFILTALIFVTKGYKLKPYQAKKCTAILIFKYNLQTTVLDLDGNTDEDLKTCILKNVNNHSLILIAGYNTYSNVLLHNERTTDVPNNIIITKHLNPKVLDYPSIRRVLYAAHRSMVYITVTDEERFKCKDGTLNPSDFLLLETFMNLLWHKYEIMRVGVIFPLACQEIMAVYNGKKKTDKILYDRTITLIDTRTNTYKALRKSGQSLAEIFPLRANIFYRYPTSITKCEKLHYYAKINLNLTQGYCGIDAMVMHDIAKHFKFDLYFPKNVNCYKYGYMTDNNITGSLGCIVRHELDISFNSRFMTKYSDDYIYFLHYVTVNSLCVVIKQPEVIPIEIYAVAVFRLRVWFVIISSIIAIGMITWVVAKVTSKLVVTKIHTLWFYVEDAFTTLLFGFSLKKKITLYILRGTCLCGSILFAAMYQGRINYMFTTLLRYDSFKTRDALYESEYTLYLNPSMDKIMTQLYDPKNKAQNDFVERSQLITENYTLDLLFEHPHVALIGRREDVVMEILSQYTDEHERPLVDIIDDCFYTYYLSYITRSGFPFYEEMQRFMQRLGEAGLPIIYHKWTSDMLGVPNAMPKIRDEPRSFAKIKLSHERIPFGILILGYILSMIVFIIELVRGKRRFYDRARK